MWASTMRRSAAVSSGSSKENLRNPSVGLQDLTPLGIDLWSSCDNCARIIPVVPYDHSCKEPGNTNWSGRTGSWCIVNDFVEVRASSKKSTLVARQILDAFENRRFAPGDKLPPERVLAQDMKVSRTCVREALKALEVLGLIESRVGDGTYVLPDATDSNNWLRGVPSANEDTDLVDIWEARAEIEAVVVRLAIGTATTKAIARIESHLKKMHQMAKAGDAEGYLDLDRQFHMAIARAADNPLLESIISPLIQLINKSLLEDIPRTRVARRLKVSLTEHERLVDAIKRRAEDEAAEIVRDHFKKVREFYGSMLW